MLFTLAVLLANEGLFARLVAHILFNAAVSVGLAGNNANMSCHRSQGLQNSTVSFNNFQGAIHAVSCSPQCANGLSILCQQRHAILSVHVSLSQNLTLSKRLGCLTLS